MGSVATISADKEMQVNDRKHHVGWKSFNVASAYLKKCVVNKVKVL